MSTKQRVVFQGVVRGEGREVTCSISALKVTEGGLPPAFCKYKVEEFPQDLPEGAYEVIANGETWKARLIGGQFLADGV